MTNSKNNNEELTKTEAAAVDIFYTNRLLLSLLKKKTLSKKGLARVISYFAMFPLDNNRIHLKKDEVEVLALMDFILKNKQIVLESLKNKDNNFKQEGEEDVKG
jgi:hypothetical protein